MILGKPFLFTLSSRFIEGKEENKNYRYRPTYCPEIVGCNSLWSVLNHFFASVN